MSPTEKLETVWFTTKGQVVIPLRLRKQFDIEDGTKAVVQATSEGILLKPVTAALIRRGRRVADYLRAECLAVYVSKSQDLSDLSSEERESLDRQLNFARAYRMLAPASGDLARRQPQAA